MHLKKLRRSAAAPAVRRTLAAVLALALLVPALCQPVLAAGTKSEPTVVRVGYFSNGDFMHKAANGSLAGYDIEYYYTLAGYAGWQLRFVEYDSLAQALTALENGDIDVMSGLSKTGEREASYLISSQKMCTSHIAVQTRAEDDRFAAGDLSTMADMRCGILRGSNVEALYKNWCAENGLTPHVTEYDSLNERNAALSSREVDAIAAGSTIEGAQKIAEFPALDLYFMLNKNRTDLKAQLDRAMSLLSLQDPTYATILFDRYFPSSRNRTPSFSAEEKKFVGSHADIRVALLANDAPFSSERADGSVSGILPEYYDHLADIIGARFTYVPCASKEAACQALADGSADLIGKFEENIFDADSHSVILTVPFLRMNLVEITRAGTGTVESAAVPECNAGTVSATTAASGGELRLVSTANSESAFSMLKGGRWTP